MSAESAKISRSKISLIVNLGVLLLWGDYFERGGAWWRHWKKNIGNLSSLEILIIFEILSYAADQINNHSTDFGNEYFFDEICTFGKFHVFDAPVLKWFRSYLKLLMFSDRLNSFFQPDVWNCSTFHQKLLAKSYRERQPGDKTGQVLKLSGGD